MLYQKIKKCRICGNPKLNSVLDLGIQSLTGVFPKKNKTVEKGPLELVKCSSRKGDARCGLLQLKHDYNMEKLYGDSYGYRSGLNKTMVKHLRDIVSKIEKRVVLKKGDLVIDIASNDGILLSAYKNKKLNLVGIDPTAKKFKEYYPKHIKYIPKFFSSKVVNDNYKNKKAKVVTSIAMFYDLPSPLKIMREIESVLADDGIWVVEQSYMPNMIENVSYDTICHEHLEYYALKQFKWMADHSNLKIIDIGFNDTNGASFCLTLAKKESSFKEVTKKIEKILNEEEKNGFNDFKIYKNFKQETLRHKKELIRLFKECKKDKKVIFGYGASTKGNVILQYCGFDSNDIPYIAEVNEDKFGRFTPGSKIPIVSEKEAKDRKPDYFLVLPWHFKKFIIKRESSYLKSGGKLIFPLPKIDII
jgi:NDP-4-keto-2,6-dideoxyhexose 3-C-methyltransferase